MEHVKKINCIGRATRYKTDLIIQNMPVIKLFCIFKVVIITDIIMLVPHVVYCVFKPVINQVS